jgi:hypothetical protein
MNQDAESGIQQNQENVLLLEERTAGHRRWPFQQMYNVLINNKRCW